MKAADYRVCPACDTRNKAKWDFCIRCGESLQGVPTTREVQAAAAPARGPRVSVAAPDSSNPVLMIVGVVALGALGYISWQYFANTPAPERPDPGIFTAATVPPGLPQAPPARSEPGLASFEQGRRLLAEGDGAAAMKLLAQAVADAPTNALYRNAYAAALETNKLGEEALREFAEAARLAPATYTGDLARALERAGKKAEAIETYEKALSLRPSDHELTRDAANLLLASGRADRALPLLQQAAATNPQDMAVQQYLGWAVEQKGDLGAAADIYGKILEKLPEADVTRGRLAEVLFKQGQQDKAIALVQDGVKRAPESPLLHRGLAGLLERAGRNGEAAAEYREYARLAPNAGDAQKYTDRAQELERRAAAKKPS